ncbi:MAG: NUDIX hydrolase [Patescibacteria group bacterium]
MEKYNFQYCPKIAVLSSDKNKVLLCRRKGEVDYNDIFSFIGGKMETTDASIVAGLKREKDEEVGQNFQLKLYPKFSINILIRKKDGHSMIVSYYLAIHEKGDIELSEEYSEYQWVKLAKLAEFEPKFSNISEVINELRRLEKIAAAKDFILI